MIYIFLGANIEKCQEAAYKEPYWAHIFAKYVFVVKCKEKVRMKLLIQQLFSQLTKEDIKLIIYKQEKYRNCLLKIANDNDLTTSYNTYIDNLCVEGLLNLLRLNNNQRFCLLKLKKPNILKVLKNCTNTQMNDILSNILSKGTQFDVILAENIINRLELAELITLISQETKEK